MTETPHRFTCDHGDTFMGALPGSDETEAFVCPCTPPALPAWRLWSWRQYACAAFLCAVPVLVALTVWAVVRQAVGA